MSKVVLMPTVSEDRLGIVHHPPLLHVQDLVDVITEAGLGGPEGLLEDPDPGAPLHYFFGLRVMTSEVDRTECPAVPCVLSMPE